MSDPTPTSDAPPAATTTAAGQINQGIGLQAFLTSLSTAVTIFAVQFVIFLLLRNKLPRIFRPKTYMVPDRERTEPPPVSPWGLFDSLLRFKDRELIKKSGLDAYFFLRYLQTMLVIFIPIACIILPILVPINFIGGVSEEIKTTNPDDPGNKLKGLETIAWGNVKPENHRRRWAHLVCALAVIGWVCAVVFYEFRVYIKIRQDYLTSAEHRLRASSNTVLVSGIPQKWLTEEALQGLFDVFPGGIRNIWITRDFTKLLDKIRKRDEVHGQLEGAQTELIRMAKRKQMKIKQKEDEKERKSHHIKAFSKSEKKANRKAADVDAKRRAEANAGVAAGDEEEVPDIDTAVEDTRQEDAEKRADQVQGAFKSQANDSDRAKKAAAKVAFEEEDRQQPGSEKSPTTDRPYTADSNYTAAPSAGTRPSFEPGHFANTTRKVTDWDNLLGTEESKWWQFWKPPSGAYASPIPQGYEGDEYPLRPTETKSSQKAEKSIWVKIFGWLPFVGGEDEEVIEYPEGFIHDVDEEADEGAAWMQYLKKSDRPRHRLRLFEWTPLWFPGIPFTSKKVDTIYWCRKELARLNMEIEEDQAHPERYPAMNSAFIQFNNQVAAHMCCQSVAHHVPKQMAPRMVEVSPDDVLWDNMAISWWAAWLRSFLAIALVVGMIVLWAIPVAFISSISQVDALVKTFPWLGFLTKTESIAEVTRSVAGVLPALLLAIALALIPTILEIIATYQGAKTGAQRSEWVQIYFFAFLFVQVFLVLSIAGGTLKTLSDTLQDVQGVPALLARNLPGAANFFFSYMILQAMSTSAGTLLQIGTLIVWFLLARMMDNTARSKWSRQTGLNSITWGSFFPIYTNFACIGLIYCVIAPLISVFAIITFGLLWFAHRYNMCYVVRFKIDTGGVLYPRALNQTFTGLYFMELCLIGLFFLVQDELGNFEAKTQGIIMVVVLILTVLYQYMLNQSFGPVLRYLPITFEDEAALRDEAFQRAQDRRLGIVAEDDESTPMTMTRTDTSGDDVEMKELGPNGRTGTFTNTKLGKLAPVKGLVGAGTWAARHGKRAKKATLGKAEQNLKTAADYRRERRRKDLEAQRATGEALYGGYHDEIEDLTPEERNALVRQAFKHSALRARPPTVWIPRDDLGVSDDEIARTRRVSERYLRISNEGTALDSKVRVVYGQSPPDFASTELINL